MPLVLPAELHRDIDGIVADYELTTLIERLLPVIKLILITEAAQSEISKGPEQAGHTHYRGDKIH